MASKFTKTSIMEWLKTEFLPVTLATPDTGMSQIIDNALRYWNSHSALRRMAVVPFTNSTVSVQLDPMFKEIVAVMPNYATNWIMEGYPVWSLLGITVLDNMSSDLIITSEAFRNYSYYLGTDFRFSFEKGADPTEGGYLYIQGFPPQATKAVVVGTTRLNRVEQILDEHTQDWILNYCKALLKMNEGTTLRKADIIAVSNDGQRMFDEGESLKKELQEALMKEGRWVTFASRM
jgi:hypothetical protein